MHTHASSITKKKAFPLRYGMEKMWNANILNQKRRNRKSFLIISEKMYIVNMANFAPGQSGCFYVLR